MEKWPGYPFKNDIVALFHALYRKQSDTVGPPWVSWRGVNALKCPMDLWIYQEIISSYQPDSIIEGGTASGGSALFMADVCNAVGVGHVYTMDLDNNPNWPQHDRITYLTGDTLSPELYEKVNRMAWGKKMLVLDDGHSHTHVRAELELWWTILNPGDYLVVEDTNLGGPLWALDDFLEAHPGLFERVPACEKLLLTFNPLGYLRRV